jgi:hypothetical protein
VKKLNNNGFIVLTGTALVAYLIITGVFGVGFLGIFGYVASKFF